MPVCQIKVYRDRTLACSFQVDQPTLVGRRDSKRKDPPPIQLTLGKDPKLVVADAAEVRVSRTIFRLTPHDECRFSIENINRVSSLELANDSPIAVGASQEFAREVVVEIGSEMVLRITPAGLGADVESHFRSLGSLDAPLGLTKRGTLSSRESEHGVGSVGSESSHVVTKTIGQFEIDDVKEIAQMLRLALGVVQRAAGTSEFFQASAEATAQIVNLDHAMVLLRSAEADSLGIAGTVKLPDGWLVVAQHSKLDFDDDDLDFPFAASDLSQPACEISSSLLKRVMETSSTVIHDPSSFQFSDGHHAPSLNAIECAVASPIVNQQSEVVGVLYGYRAITGEGGSQAIRDHEATLVEILAGSLAGGIARQTQERFRFTLSEFFSPRVANLLETRPELMEGQDVEVSVLFCDIRGFSSVTEKLGPQKSIAWINDVMSELSQCVINRDGVLVDYVGDELLAMWGAPGEQLQHAALAVETARAMLSAIEVLRERWKDVLPSRFGAGIGVNTGMARVGNVGSRQKFKYGPLGQAINIGSRLQSATKQFAVDCLISGASASAAGCLSSSRRLAKLTVVGMADPIDVYQIVVNPDRDWENLVKQYQESLVDYEQTRFVQAAKRLGNLMSMFPDDRPSRMLLARALQAMDDNPQDDFDSILRLNTK